MLSSFEKETREREDEREVIKVSKSHYHDLFSSS